MTKPQQQRNFSLYFSWYLPMLCNATRYYILHNISDKYWLFSSTCSRNDQNTGCVVSIPSSFLSPLVLKGKLRKMWIWCWVQIVPWPFLQAKPNPALCFDHNHITSGESVFQSRLTGSLVVVRAAILYSVEQCLYLTMFVPLQCLYLTRFKSKTLNSFNFWHSEFIYR